jgi:hypothetical protein
MVITTTSAGPLLAAAPGVSFGSRYSYGFAYVGFYFTGS